MSNLNTRSLVNTQIDFWLLGGLSVAVWLILIVLQNFKDFSFVQSHFNNLPYTVATLALVCNYPHFLASYRLAYTRGFDFVWQNKARLILAPALLIGLFLGAYFADSLNQKIILGQLVNIMYFTVGWHYTKQAFGCVMVYSNYEGYKLTRFQKELLRWNLLTIWWVTLSQSNLYGGSSSYYGLSYYQWNFYDWLYPVANGALAFSALGVLYFVFYKNWQQGRAWPSMRVLIPIIAMYVWWVPVARQNEFYMYLTPFFHSLQYLAFIYKIEKESIAQSQLLSGYKVILGLFLSGWVAFEFLPHGLDQAFATQSSFGVPYFIVSITLFINIHHYFIDNAIWRFKDPSVKKYILGA